MKIVFPLRRSTAAEIVCESCFSDTTYFIILNIKDTIGHVAVDPSRTVVLDPFRTIVLDLFTLSSIRYRSGKRLQCLRRWCWTHHYQSDINYVGTEWLKNIELQYKGLGSSSSYRQPSQKSNKLIIQQQTRIWWIALPMTLVSYLLVVIVEVN